MQSYCENRVVIINRYRHRGNGVPVHELTCNLAPTQSDADLDIIVSGRSLASYEAAKKERPALESTSFQACDIDDRAALDSALKVAVNPLLLAQLQCFGDTSYQTLDKYPRRWNQPQ